MRRWPAAHLHPQRRRAASNARLGQDVRSHLERETRPAGRIPRRTAIADRQRRTEMTKSAAPPREDVVLTRVLDAPRITVFNCWTDPKHFAKWFGPKDWTNPVCELDARPGGAIKVVMRGPKGQEQMSPGEFREVVP